MQNDFHDLIAAKTPEVAVALAALQTAGATNVLLGGLGIVRLLRSARSRENRAHPRQRLALASDVRALCNCVCRDAGVAMTAGAVDAVVLAGGPQDDVALLQPGAPNKAFVEIDGVTLIGRVLAALRVLEPCRANRRRCAAVDASASRFDSRRRSSPRRRADHREPA